jgi:hypothetical protein
MKTKRTFKSNLGKDTFIHFTLTNEEMICVRGGEGDATTIIIQPPVKI